MQSMESTRRKIRIADLGIEDDYLPPKALGLVVIKNWEALVDINNGKYFKIEPLV